MSCTRETMKLVQTKFTAKCTKKKIVFYTNTEGKNLKNFWHVWPINIVVKWYEKIARVKLENWYK